MERDGFAIGVDTGGTFTDVALLKKSGTLVIGKAATTPHDFSIGVMNAVRELADQERLSVPQLLDRVTVFKHSTTVATNALITRTGPRVGLITTRGFEDTCLIMRAIGRVDGLPEEEIQHVTYATKPEPLVPRDLVRGVTERIDYQGQILVDLNLLEVDEAIDGLQGAGCTAIAVSLLHAWVNPLHEDAIRRRIEERAGHRAIYWSFGSDLARVAGEYARTNTAIVNAFVGPTVTRYLDDLEGQLRGNGLRGSFLVMQGNGGASGREQSSPIGNLQSGPAGGLLAAAHLASALGHSKVLTADMGGTSFDVGLVVDGAWKYADEPIFERLRILQPIAEITSIGAGGGTIARVEPAARRLLVGPQSAGASPGPVCYDEGGTEITVTDANVLLGLVNPEYFLGGRKTLNKAKAEAVMRRTIAEPLGWSVLAAAAGVYEIVNNKMADLIRRQVVKSGHLPEEFVLYAFGGAGPLHAAEYARELGIDSIYVFPTSSVFSAFGAASADVIHSRVVTFQAVLPFGPELLNRRLESVERELAALMGEEGFAPESVRFRRFVSMRFRRQTYGVEVPLPWPRLDAGTVVELGELFQRRYEDLYGRGSGFVRAGMEIHTLRIDAVGPVGKPSLVPQPLGSPDAGRARRGSRQVYFQDGFLDTALYGYDELVPGNRLEGPAIVEATFTTILIPRDYVAEMDAYRNLVLRKGGRPRG